MVNKRGLRGWATKNGLSFRDEGLRIIEEDPIKGAQAFGTAIGFAEYVAPLMAVNIRESPQVGMAKWSPEQQAAFHQRVRDFRAAAMQQADNLKTADFRFLGWLEPTFCPACSSSHGVLDPCPSAGAKELMTDTSVEDIWDKSTNLLGRALAVLYNRAEHLKVSKSKAKAEFQSLVEMLTPAMYGFEELVTVGSRPELSEPLARGTRDLLEGLLNNDNDRVSSGLEVTRVAMLEFLGPEEGDGPPSH